MSVEVFDIRNEKALEKFQLNRHISAVRYQVGSLAKRSPKDWMVGPLFEGKSATRYILWEDDKLSGVVEQLDYMNNGNGWQLYNRQTGNHIKNIELHTFYNMVFCYGCDAEVVGIAFDQAMEVTGGKLLVALDPKDENSSLWIARGKYNHSDGKWRLQSSNKNSAQRKHNLVEIVTFDRPILAGASVLADDKFPTKHQFQASILYNMLMSKVAADRGLFYTQ